MRKKGDVFLVYPVGALAFHDGDNDDDDDDRWEEDGLR